MSSFNQQLNEIAEANQPCIIVGVRLEAAGPITSASECIRGVEMSGYDAAAVLAAMRLQLELLVDLWADRLGVSDTALRDEIAEQMNELRKNQPGQGGSSGPLR